MEEKLGQFLKAHFSCDILQATNEQLYQALVWYIREIVGKMEQNVSKKAEKQEYVREVVAVGVFGVALCAVCAFMNGTGYVPFSVVC